MECPCGCGAAQLGQPCGFTFARILQARAAIGKALPAPLPLVGVQISVRKFVKLAKDEIT
jgi:hypothetical protein